MAETALVVVDTLNTYDHEDADKLAASAEQAVPVLVKLIEGAREADVPVIYVNDNFGDWSSSREKLVETALAGKRPDLVEPIVPGDDDHFMFKVRHSAFFGTSLEYLLYHLGLDRVVLAGQATEQCVLYSALDAFIRHHQLVVPGDATAYIYEHLAEAALEMMRRNMHAETPSAEAVEWS